MVLKTEGSKHEIIAAGQSDRAEKWAKPAFLALLAILCIAHIIYLSLSGLTPSADEAHYMSGALSIADGVRTGTLSGAWAGYRDALGFKAPLICVPAAFIMLFTKTATWPFSATLVLTFAALGLSAFSLFQNCFSKFQSACAATVLLCMPLVTGLTHRYYVELLVLLLSIFTLDLLLRMGWRTYPAAVSIGIVVGLGILAKTTFPLLLGASVGYSLWIEVRLTRAFSSVSIALDLLWKVLAAGITALVVAGPWYAKNWIAVIAHVREASSAAAYYYAHWIIADTSNGPSILIALLALIGVAVIIKTRMAETSVGSRNAWVMIILMGVSTIAGVSVSVGKTPRFEVTVLPMFAALAVAAFYPLQMAAGGKWFRAGLSALAGCSVILALHNCFHILPVPAIRFGDAQLIGSIFSVGLPEYFDDNSPLDRRPFRRLESQVESRIAADAAHFGPGATIHIATTESSLLFNHYYFEFLSGFRKHPLHYLPWFFHQVAIGPDAPNYIIHTSGFNTLYPGSTFFAYYPRIEDDVARHLIPYTELFRVAGPNNSQIIVFKKKQLSLIQGDAPTAILLEGEQFSKGNLAIDNRKGSYGEGIGVVLTPKPGGYAEYAFTVPDLGDYQIQVRYASLVSRPLTLLIDSQVITGSAASSTTGGFMPANQMWEPVAIASLAKGSHLLRLETKGLFPHLDRITIVKVPPGTRY